MAFFYVSTTGSDSNSGASGSPVKSLTKAAQLAQPGDTVLVGAGTYNGTVTISKNGTASAPITFKPVDGAHVIIDGSGTSANTDLVTITGDYITFQGFEVRNSTRTGIALWETHNSKVLDNNVHDSYRAGIWVGGNVGQTYNNLVDGNEVWRNVKENMARTSSGGWAQGISLDKSDGSVISNNNVYDNWGEGVGAMFTKGAKITGNVVYDSYSVGIYLDNAQDAVVQHNTVSHSYDTNFYRSGKPASGIQIANENGDRMLPSSGIVATDNILAGVGNLVYSSYGGNTGLSNSTIAPNTIYSSPDSVPSSESAPAPIPTPSRDPVASSEDVFTFNTAIGRNVEIISDFHVASDSVALDNSIFTKLLRPGELSSRFFTVGETAKDKNDYIIYNKTTGVLSYDADGSDAGGAVKFAVIENKAALSAAHFLVI
jgi:parallel beta-helix repeat protein